MPFKKTIWFIVIVVVIVIILAFAFLRIGFDGRGEDSWIKDENGIYVKYGNPSQTPDFVKEQQQSIIQAKQLCENEKSKQELISQCLGSIGDFAIDIVHVPRNADIDNKAENQCADYRNGLVKHFLELDKNCEIVRIV